MHASPGAPDPPTWPRVGIVGGGQLARMLAAAAIPLGVGVELLAEDEAASAAQVVPATRVGRPDEATLAALAARCEVVTFDHELVDGTVLADLAAEGAPLAPSPAALRLAQDKAHQRATFEAAGLPVPPYRLADDVEDAAKAAEAVGWPVVVKAPRGGYDGRGTATARDRTELPHAWEAVGGGPGLIEQQVPLAAEVAVLVARRRGTGDTAVYPATETVQEAGICTELVTPARLPEQVRGHAETLASRVAELVAADGICAVELFWTGEHLLVNEIATRPHNSGHWTIEGATTSQFSNHLRGVLGWPLGDAAARAPATVTVNLLGPPDGRDPAARLPAALAVSDASVHLYGKAARPGRKLGHVTVCGPEVAGARQRAHDAAGRLLDPPADPP